MSSASAREPFEAPIGRKDRKKRSEKVIKERLHIYISGECIGRIDLKAEELGLDRSPCIQMLLNYALNNIKTIPYFVQSQPGGLDVQPASAGE